MIGENTFRFTSSSLYEVQGRYYSSMLIINKFYIKTNVRIYL